MPAGGGGVTEYQYLHFFENWLEKHDVHISQAKLLRILHDLKGGYQNADRKFGGPDLLKDVYAYASTGNNPYGEATDGGPRVYEEGTATHTPLPDNPSDIADERKAERLKERRAERREHRQEMREERKRTARKNLAAAFKNQLTSSWGMPITPEIADLIQTASHDQWSSARFYMAIRNTADYKDRFVGIFDDNGTLKMSESDYLRREQQFQDIAAKAGMNVSDKRLGYLFKNDVSPTEFSQRAPAMRALEDNPELFKQFAAELQRHGVDKSEINDASIFKTIMGEGNNEWHNIWQMTVARDAAVQAGIKIGAGHGFYGALPRNLIKRVANKGFDQASLSQGFQQIAENLLTTMPLSSLQHYGLTKGELVQASFGGKKQAEVLRKIKHIQAAEEAGGQDRAVTDVGTTSYKAQRAQA